MKITIEILDKDETEFLEGILRQIPIPKDEETNKELYTAQVWLQRWIRSRLVKLYKDGRRHKVVREAEDKIVYNIKEVSNESRN